MGVADRIDARQLGAAIVVVSTVWGEVSASLLGHSERPFFRALSENRADPLIRGFAPGPRPVGAAGTAAARGRLWKQKRFHSRPPSAWKSPVKLEIPTVPWKTQSRFPRAPTGPTTAGVHSRNKKPGAEGRLKSQGKRSERG